MRFAEITLIVELSEEISDAKTEARLMDDINTTLVDFSENVAAVRSVTVKDCTAECEAQ